MSPNVQRLASASNGEGAKVLLEMKGVHKGFPGVRALSGVDLVVKSGTVHALIGENGAGKSTLMKILAGIYQPDEGSIRFKGEPVAIADPRASINCGIAMIHQELSSIPEMSIAENVFLGREPVFGLTRIVDTRTMHRNTRVLFAEIGMEVEPGRLMSDLSVAEMQMVEIVKAISYDSDLIIMDEPTSAITDREVEKLFEIIRTLTAKGKSVIYISHKLDELFVIADEITVMRDGTYITTQPAEEMSRQQLISLMVGRELRDIYPGLTSARGEIALEVEDLASGDRFSNIDFKLHRGEILGIAGLMGAGRTELVETVFGFRKATAGSIRVNGEPVVIDSVRKAIDLGMALVSEDRKLFGLNLKASVKDNITLVDLARFCRLNQIIDFGAEKRAVDAQIRALGIKTPSRNQNVNSLSGGNQQKVVLAKWLLCEPEILILDEPTRGIDVGAKAEVHKIMAALAEAGKAVIMISSELPEILGMSHRVLVLHEGRKTGEFSREELDQEKIMACATGHQRGQ